jgi:hypothetical protein
MPSTSSIGPAGHLTWRLLALPLHLQLLLLVQYLLAVASSAAEAASVQPARLQAGQCPLHNLASVAETVQLTADAAAEEQQQLG